MHQPPCDPSGCFAFRMRRAMRALARHYDQALAPTGLRITQFSVLAALRPGRHRDLTHLADMLGLERTSLLRALATLRAAGLLDEAQRPTEAGEARFQAALPCWRRAQAQVADLLGDQLHALDTLEHLGATLGRPARPRLKESRWTDESGC